MNAVSFLIGMIVGVVVGIFLIMTLAFQWRLRKEKEEWDEFMENGDKNERKVHSSGNENTN